MFILRPQSNDLLAVRRKHCCHERIKWYLDHHDNDDNDNNDDDDNNDANDSKNNSNNIGCNNSNGNDDNNNDNSDSVGVGDGIGGNEFVKERKKSRNHVQGSRERGREASQLRP